MGRRPECRDEPTYFALAVAGQQYAEVQLAEMNARPQQGDGQKAEEQARAGSRVPDVVLQHRGICTLEGGAGFDMDANCSLA